MAAAGYGVLSDGVLLDSVLSNDAAFDSTPFNARLSNRWPGDAFKRPAAPLPG